MKMICPKCGNEYNDNFRCCFKCGALNPRNKENIKNNTTKSILDIQQKELDKYSNSFYSIKKIKVLDNKILYIIINIIISLIIFLALKTLGICSNNLLLFIYSLIIVGYLICLSFIFNKSDYTWWKAYIPIYNIGLFFKMLYGNIKLFLFTIILSFIPVTTFFSILDSEYLDSNLKLYFLFWFLPIIYIIIGVTLIIIYIITMFKISKKFNTNTILTILFGFIMIPVIAFKKEYNYIIDKTLTK